MQVRVIDGAVARCDAGGIHRDVNLMLLDEPVVPGDYVLVHVGYALRRLEPAAAAGLAALRAGGPAADA
jgi:hydrogenase expression/formation protein HypC